MTEQEALRQLDTAIEVEKAKRLEKTITNAIASGFAGIKINVPKADVPKADVTVHQKEIVLPPFPKVPTPEVTVNVPEIKLPPFPKIPTPEVTVKVPEIKIPTIKVPKPEVTVNFDASKIKVPVVNIPPFPEFPAFPSEMDVRMIGITEKQPLPVMVMNPTSQSAGGSRGGKVVSVPQLIDVPKVGQAKIATTGTAVQLADKEFINGVLITALSTNTGNILIGEDGLTNTEDGTGNGYILEPGNTASFAVMNLKRLFINGTTGDIISYVGS